MPKLTQQLFEEKVRKRNPTIHTKYHCCIEFDGQQHFEPNEFFGGEESLKKTQERDNIKDNFCSSNNILLLRIPYWEIDNIKDKIKNFLHI